MIRPARPTLAEALLAELPFPRKWQWVRLRLIRSTKGRSIQEYVHAHIECGRESFMARGAVLCYWRAPSGKWSHNGGHLGIAVESNYGRSWISWGMYDENNMASLHHEFRKMTGASGERNQQLAMTGTPRAGQVSTKDGPVFVKMGSQAHKFAQGQLIQLPTAVCEIPAIDLNKNVLGLDVERMHTWCLSFRIGENILSDEKNSPLPYEKVSVDRNCSGMVLQGLRIGGASYYSSKKFKTFFVTPKEVFWYAFRLVETINDLNKKNAGVQMSTAEWSKKMRGLTVSGPLAELPTVAEWKAMSKVAIGARKEQILNIDRALATYCQHKWPDDNDFSEASRLVREEKAASLCIIFREAAEHAALKPTSGRKHAVAAILSLCWQVIKNRFGAIKHGTSEDVWLMFNQLGLDYVKIQKFMSTDQFCYKPGPESA